MRSRATPTPSTAPPVADCAVLELRQYRLRPSTRDALAALFLREFVDTQQQVGMRVIGPFRDLDDPDRFTWLRGFADLASRARGLAAFYGGPTWAAHGPAANATMLAFDDVLLLRPAWPGAAIEDDRALVSHGRLLDATVFTLNEPATDEVLALAEGPMTRALRAGGATAVHWYLPERDDGGYPRLPVRDEPDVLVGFASFPDEAAFEAFAASGAWRRDVAPRLARHLVRSESRRLVPTEPPAFPAAITHPTDPTEAQP